MTQQNIHYELTKQRTDQSMGSKGALASFERLDHFLGLHTHKLTYKKPSLQYFVWVDGEQAVETANKLERKLFSDFGAQKKRPKGFSLFKSKDHYEEIFKWELDANIKQHLGYIDELGALSGLEPRPPLSIVISAGFWLHDAKGIENMKSYVIAWLSPNSNKASFILNFPHNSADDEFARYRNILQADCPVKLEDKFFYIRKARSDGGYSFRKAFNKP